MAPVATIPRSQWRPPSRARVAGLRRRLREVYGVPAMEPHEDPLAELVLTVLSQSTNDRNRDVAYLRLRAELPSWEAVRDAPVDQIEAAIQPGGLHVQKSRRIKAMLETIGDDRLRAAARRAGAAVPEQPSSQLDLSWMRDAPVAESREFLCSLPGVGRKTAACVLLFAYGLPDIPVDTHVSRVGTRLGLLRPGGALDPELHDAMLALTPAGAELEFHVNLLRHGRRTCHAQRPDCLGCALRRGCPGRLA